MGRYSIFPHTFRKTCEYRAMLTNKLSKKLIRPLSEIIISYIHRMWYHTDSYYDYEKFYICEECEESLWII
jgi:hypothetical protein